MVGLSTSSIPVRVIPYRWNMKNRYRSWASDALSFSNQAAAKHGLSSGNSPAVPPPKKKLNPSVRPCSDMRFNEIDLMIERSSKQQRCKLEGRTFKTTSFCEKCEA
ncbi:hypothetical protein AVEN_208382-1 [Araneus ventricosus]|uniref:Uncharacterized protein n=1 Tax=Araneus ventricosus TaxID=182803 RepID=A0A4Y2N3Q7_ARAVE|nr:hypothetical protein AVEN_208382-1 [Araneus ventricosus]